MAKNIRPEVNNPLANMGLDEIVRGITHRTRSRNLTRAQVKSRTFRKRESGAGKAGKPLKKTSPNIPA